MHFNCNGQTYDTAMMTACRLDNPAMPCIYVSADGRQVFLPDSGGFPGSFGGGQFHCATPPEIERLASQYGINQLRRAMPDASPGGPMGR